jgi:hypothetical protein
MLSDSEMFDRMKDGWNAGKSDGTICGNGSTLKNTANIRKWLPKIIEKYGIETLSDAGAGDMHWVKKTPIVCEYRPFDLIPRHESVTQIDFTRKELPPCDAILCRMVLNHLDTERILMALKLFKQSAVYLIATQFDGDKLPQRSPQFTRLDLRKEPYYLGEPVESIQDGSEAMWEL